MASRVETPERFDPAQMRGQLLEAEHLARYWWATALAPGKTVLDVGCGTAYGSMILAHAGALEVTGLDIDAELLDAERERVGEAVSLVAADARELPFEGSTFDCVVCFEVIEHVDDPQAILDELRRVVRPDGIVVVSSPNRDVYPPGNPHHKHEFHPEELANELERRFEHVRIMRQHDWLASAILNDDEFAGEAEALEANARTVVPRAPGEELYSLALASPAPLPRLRPQIVLTSTMDVKWWGERLSALERQLTHARRKHEELEDHARAAADRLLEVERQRVVERQQFATELAQLERLVAFMRSTRIWRVGTSYWRIRDRLPRRSPGSK